MNESKITTLWIGALRYYMGRMSYAVVDFCDLLIEEWPNLPKSTRALIKRDLMEEIKRDDEYRADGRDCKSLGMDCDRAAWDRVAALWSCDK